MTAQPSLFEAARLCAAGEEHGEACGQPVTHRACWSERGQSGGVESCRSHADYYASAWAFPLHPGYEYLAGPDLTVWVEILEVTA